MTAIFHITHCDNLQAIVEHDGLWSDVQCQARGIRGRTIGYDHIKQRRMEYEVPLAPGGSLGDYVPFYFAPRSPMLYTIHRRNTDYQGGQEPVIHLVSSAEAVAEADPPLNWLFTDGHAVIDLSAYYHDLDDLDEVDWDIMRARYWRDTLEDGDRLRRRQAEFLVHRFFPWDLVGEIGVFDAKAERFVRNFLRGDAHEPEVNVRPNWYY